MRFLLIFVLILLPVLGGAGLAYADQVTPAPAADSDSTGVPADFAGRFSIPPLDPKKGKVLTPVSYPGIGSACVPTQGFNAHGFYALGQKARMVDFSVYSRLLYYGLTPGTLGNLEIPLGWNGPEVTQKAHQHGAKVDLVIRNDVWDVTGKGEGLRLEKSFVVLNMVDEIVDMVVQFEFDGVVIDFRLPEKDGDGTRETFRFFLKRLKDRLNAASLSPRANDLLDPGKRQLSVVIDSKSNFEYEPTNPPTPFVHEVVAKTFESVDLWIVSGDGSTEEGKAAAGRLLADIESDRVAARGLHPGVTPPMIASVLFNSDQDELLLKTSPAVVWDVANQNGDKKWGGILDKIIVGKDFNPKHEISARICTQRTAILGGLSVLTPLVVLMLVLSWLLYDFPYYFNRAKATLAIWGLLVVVVVVFLALVYSLPSVDFKHTGVYVIVASLAVPLGGIIWTALSQMSRPDNP